MVGGNYFWNFFFNRSSYLFSTFQIMSAGCGKIFVAIRKRPLMRFERDKGGNDVIDTSPQHIYINEPKVRYDLTKYTEKHNFAFDRVFSDTEDNQTVFKEACRPLLETFLKGGTATCFAYGQTGSGKTHTMIGRKEDKGMYLLAAEEIFRQLRDRDVYISFYEIYGRKIFDLLNERAKLVAREDADKSINICGLTEHSVTSVNALMQLMNTGNAQRSAGVTGMNADSSRSHAILRVELKQGGRKCGILSFIDLAGNERGSDTMNCDRQTRVEGAEINKSLLALKECIRALGMGKNHIPFRGSILTEVLRDSFLGNSKTTMIANVSPSSTNCEHTLNTLRYTDRVKELKSDGKAKQRRPTAGRRGPAVKGRDERTSGAAVVGNVDEEAMQIVRRLRPQITEEDGEDDDDVAVEVEKCYSHIASALSDAQEDLLVHYRRMLDTRVKIMLKETEAIQALDQGGVRDLDNFVSDIDTCLFKNIQSINEMRDKLASLKEQLRQEEVLGRSFKPTFRL